MDAAKSRDSKIAIGCVEIERGRIDRALARTFNVAQI